MFSKTCILTLICVSASWAADKPNTLTKKESAQGWKLLFDGSSMNGWESHWADSFHVKDGALACDGSVMSWLSTRCDKPSRLLTQADVDKAIKG